jgi:hypothetical protein
VAPSAQPTSSAPASVQACDLVSLDQVKALIPQTAKSVSGFSCGYEDASGKQVLQIQPQHVGTGAKAQTAFSGPGGTSVTTGPLPGIGDDAAYQFQAANGNVPAHLIALAAVKDGWLVSILPQVTLPDSAPGQANFQKATDLLKSAVQKL